MLAILTREDFIARVKDRIGEATDDDSISFMEDMTDTYESLTANGAEEWRSKYEEMEKKYNDNDADWRRRYKERFFDKVEDIKKDVIDDQEEEGSGASGSNMRIEDLFK